MRFLVVLTKNNQNGQKKRRPKIGRVLTHEQKGCHVKTIEQLKILFSPKDVSYNLAKIRQVPAPLLITQGVADENRGGGDKKPPPRVG